MLGDLVTSSDFHTTYFVLQDAARHLRSNQLDELFGLSTGSERFNSLLEKARAVHGELVDKFLAVLEEQERQHNIILRRQTITGEEHRFFLALLLNVPRREKILELVKQRFLETNPVEKILDWVEELSQTRVLGSKEPNALGIDGFDDSYTIVLEKLLMGQPASANDLHSGEVPAERAQELKSKADSITQALQNSPLFAALFSNHDRAH